jgi:predicted HD phosphohydrolase
MIVSQVGFQHGPTPEHPLYAAMRAHRAETGDGLVSCLVLAHDVAADPAPIGDRQASRTSQAVARPPTGTL